MELGFDGGDDGIDNRDVGGSSGPGDVSSSSSSSSNDRRSNSTNSRITAALTAEEQQQSSSGGSDGGRYSPDTAASIACCPAVSCCCWPVAAPPPPPPRLLTGWGTASGADGANCSGHLQLHTYTSRPTAPCSPSGVHPIPSVPGAKPHGIHRSVPIR